MWKYALLAVADVEANYFVVKAYSYTSITSVMLLDCFTIPCVMVLSYFFLKAKARGPFVAFPGTCCLAWLFDSCNRRHCRHVRHCRHSCVCWWW
jgi:hypothetical protein